jgi:hypothetical protein
MKQFNTKIWKNVVGTNKWKDLDYANMDLKWESHTWQKFKMFMD